MKNAIELVSAERQRQIEKEGYTTRHDDRHKRGQLAMAAAIYATPYRLYEKEEQYVNQTRFKVAHMADYGWSLDLPHNGNIVLDNNSLSFELRIRQLVKSAALVIAEIERLQRLQEKHHAPKDRPQ